MCHTSANSSAGEAPDWSLHEGVTNSFSPKQSSAPIEESSVVQINDSAVDSLATPDNLSADQQSASDATHLQCGGLSSGAKHMQEFWCLELFAGSAGITAAMVAAGLTKSFGVESSLRHDRKAKVLRLDMLKPQCQSMILRWIRSPGLALVWMTPSSRARELPGPQNSAPLRDARHPEGVPSLKEDELRRVQAANQLFGFSATVWQLCCSLGIMCVIQNPYRSWMWFGQEMVGVLSMGCTKVLESHACMFGAGHRRRMALAVNTGAFDALARECDGAHDHEQWKDGALLKQGCCQRPSRLSSQGAVCPQWLH